MYFYELILHRERFNKSSLSNKNNISQLILNEATSALKIEDLMKYAHLLNQENLKLHINNDLFQSKLLGKTMLM